jgi:hypothetical protein
MDKRILVKYPTRQRPELFLKTLKDYHEKSFDNSSITYLVSFDANDATMTEIVLKEAYSYGNVLMCSGFSESKIHACNRDVNNITGWDIILLISDDMEVQVHNWDQIIRDDFEKYFPNGDGVLWYHDGSKQKVITTMSCMGKKYYDMFGYLYYPEYKSFFSDNEFTDIAKVLGKIKFIDHVIVKHEHPQWGGSVKHDELYERNNTPWKEDEALYYKRKSLNFKL